MNTYFVLDLMIVSAVVCIVFAIIPFLYAKLECDSPKHKLPKILSSFEWRLVFAAFTLFASFVICLGIYLFDHFTPRNETETTSAETSAVVPILDELRQVRLDEQTPCIQNEDAFFFHRWDKYHEIYVDNVLYEHAIGIKVSPDNEDDSDIQIDDRIETSESLEFTLREKYQGMTFSFGIDKTTLDAFNETGPSCFCQIVIESVYSCPSDDEPKAVVKYDSDWFDFRHASYDVYVDLSDVDTLRIKANWRYDLSMARQNCMNLAIVNPVLYEKDPAVQVSTSN